MKHKWVLEVYVAGSTDKSVQCPVRIAVESDINLSLDDDDAKEIARTALVNTNLWAQAVAIFKAAS